MASFRKRGSKWQVQIRRQGQTPLSRTFLLKTDAQEWAREMERTADRRGLPIDAKVLDKVTLRQLVERYRDTVLPRKKGAEVETYILNAFLREPMCRKPVSQIIPADFAAYRDRRLQEITSKSLKRQFSPIHNMFEVARDEWGLPILENPMDKVKLKAFDNKRERRLKAGELERIVAACQTTRNPIILKVILFALETAMRRGEILALGWDQVDLERRSVTVQESKNGYSRTIPLTSKAHVILCSLQMGDTKAFPVSSNALKLSWVRIMERANITDLHFHDLRHEAISNFAENGLGIIELCWLSGHRDPRMIMRYAHKNEKF
ncbi:MAG: tyrosine-type recombinase/integrase [Phyllobacteriaceae bacterium]|nr:tyrosine-type recombinase/integrase [Phyllobacteriaceae bacterium]